jgi:hypothetical protein
MCRNIQERWTKRFADRSTDSKQSPDVLVLKTEYNLAWNYFNASELGTVIFEYWHEWLNRANAGAYNAEFPPPPDPDDHDVEAPHEKFWDGPHGEVWAPDVRKTTIFNRRVITSRKRTLNLMDLANHWKKTVLEHLDERVLDELDEPQQSTGPQTPWQPFHDDPVRNEPIEGILDEETDDELAPARYRTSNSRRDRSPAAPGGWNNASLQGSVQRM